MTLLMSRYRPSYSISPSKELLPIYLLSLVKGYQAIIHKIINTLIVFLSFVLSFYTSMIMTLLLKIAEDKDGVL